MLILNHTIFLYVPLLLLGIGMMFYQPLNGVLLAWDQFRPAIHNFGGPSFQKERENSLTGHESLLFLVSFVQKEWEDFQRHLHFFNLIFLFETSDLIFIFYYFFYLNFFYGKRPNFH